MARKKHSGIGWLALLALPLAWCVQDKDDSAPRSTAERGASSSAANSLFSTPNYVPASVASIYGDAEHSTARTPATLYAISRVNIRAQPTTSSSVVGHANQGEAVLSRETVSGWHSVQHGAITGWIRGDLLSSHRRLPTVQSSPPAAARAFSSGSARPERSAVRGRQQESRPARGSPARSAIQGRCDCPYDLTKNGQLCGGRSAYSKPGGRNPHCYN